MESSVQQCRVCESEAVPLFKGPLLSYTVAYFECPRCRYVQTETPYWLEEAYSRAINLTDTGILVRNLKMASLVIRTLFLLGLLKGKVIDCAGGYGILTRLLRDSGVNAWWHDPFCENLVARGFEVGDADSADLVTAFEAFEHFAEPVVDTTKLFARGDNVLVSTALIPTPAPLPDAWWYYTPEHGQHVGFWRRETLEYLAKKHGRHLVSDGRSFHLFTKKPIANWRWKWARQSRWLSPFIVRFGMRSLVWEDNKLLQGLK